VAYEISPGPLGQFLGLRLFTLLDEFSRERDSVLEPAKLVLLRGLPSAH
jgi:hypothetical protein